MAWLLCIAGGLEDLIKRDSMHRRKSTVRPNAMIGIPNSIESLLLSAVWFYLRFVSMLPSNHLRKLALRCMGARIGKGVVIYSGFEIRSPWNSTILRGSVIGHNCILDCTGGILIGENVNFPSEVAIWTAQHDPQSATFDIEYAAPTVEKRAWLSFRATVLPGVTVHEGAVLAAHAVGPKIFLLSLWLVEYRPA
jgi:acetyltransferase-like isoleucine patch superfamily enzyme